MSKNPVYVVKVGNKYKTSTGLTDLPKNAIGTTCLEVAQYWATECGGIVQEVIFE